MYKAIVNKTTDDVYWKGDGKHWIPKIRQGQILVDIDDTMPPSVGDNERLVYDSANNTIAIEALPSLQHEGQTVYRPKQIREIARKKIAAIAGDEVTQFRRWRASHVLNNKADFTASQITKAQGVVDDALALDSQIKTITQERNQAIDNLNAL